MRANPADAGAEVDHILYQLRGLCCTGCADNLEALAFLRSAWFERVRNRRCLATWLLAPKSGAVGRQRFIGCQWISLEPQRPRGNNRIASRSLPPRAFIAEAVEGPDDGARDKVEP